MSWHETQAGLKNSWDFPDFSAAWGFASRCALVAEKMNHHPVIEVTWGKVTVTSISHDDGNKVTQKDKDLAVALDKLEAAHG